VPPTLLHNGIFLNPDLSVIPVVAVLLKNGTIDELYYKRSKLPGSVKRIDLKKNYVLPGFIDCHTHLISRGIELQRPNLEKCRSLNECIEKIAAAADEYPEVVFASNWDENNWRKRSIDRLNKSLLDKISKKKPIVMRRICGHCAVVNSRALEMIPENRRIVDRRTGFLYEDAALNLNEIFKPSKEMLFRAIKLGTAEALRKGITSVNEITDIERFALLQEMKKRSGLRIRFAVYILFKYYKDVLAAGLRTGLGDDFLKFCGIKIFLDGSIGARTAALIKPYNNVRFRGKILLSSRRLKKTIETAEENGVQLMIHSIGDRSTEQIVDIFDRIMKKQKDSKKKNPLRHRLEHVELITDSALSKMAELNLIASMQPNFVRRWQQPGGMYEKNLGSRYEKMNAFKSMKDYGIKVVFGSDCMPMGPLFGMPGAFEHPFTRGRLSRPLAFKIYTKEGAYATFDEDKKGALRKGMLGDFVVLDRSPKDEKNFENIRVIMTLVGGKVLYKKSGDVR